MKKLYKGKYFIVFYDYSDEDFKYMFDNVREILNFMGKETTQKNMNQIRVELYRALRSKSHIARFLTGKPLRVYIINLEDEEN